MVAAEARNMFVFPARAGSFSVGFLSTFSSPVPTTVATAYITWGVPLDDVPSFARDRANFHRMRRDLMHEYAAKYVAIYNGKVAAVGDTDNETARKFFAEHPDADVYIGYVGEESPAYQIAPASR
jgi:hypothetical protein